MKFRLDDTNLFDDRMMKPQRKKHEDGEPVAASASTADEQEAAGTVKTEDTAAESRPQKFERRFNNQTSQQKNQEPL